jgi:hypothetical protein
MSLVMIAAFLIVICALTDGCLDWLLDEDSHDNPLPDPIPDPAGADNGGPGSSPPPPAPPGTCDELPRYVYRGYRENEDPSKGFTAKVPGAGNSPLSHVQGEPATQWISLSQSFSVASEKYGPRVARVDLTQVDEEIVDLRCGIPGQPSDSVFSMRAIEDKEILVKDFIPREAILDLTGA